MSLSRSFGRYAAAFEKAYASGEWSLLEPHFTEHAIYDMGTPLFGPPAEGREAIFARFEDITRRFDKRFASRELALLEGPVERDGSVWIRGTATYSAPGVPDFVLELRETAYFEGDRIRRLEDRYTEEMEEAFARYVRDHGEKLGLALDA